MPGAITTDPRLERPLVERLVPPLLVLLPIALAVWFLILERRIAGDWGFALDDSWIHATIARNIATGHGFSFNPGERVAGSTGPLYTALLACFYFVTHEVVWTSKAIGVACFIGTALLVHRAMRRLVPTTAAPAALASLLVATSPALVWAALSGMEVTLFLILLMAGTVAWLEEHDLIAMFFWALGVWVRPDGLLLLALILVLQPKRAARRLLVLAPVLALYVAFNFWAGGTPFPQTVGMKAHFAVEPVHRTWNLLREWAALWGVSYRHTDQTEHPILLLILLLLGAGLTVRRWPVLALYGIGLPIALSLFRDHSGSHKRYLLLVVPYGMMLASMGAHGVATWAARLNPRRLFVVLAAAALVLQAALLSPMARDYAWNVQNINRMQRTLALFAKLTTPPGATIATNDIGAFGYFSDRYVVDLMGLVTPLRPLPVQLQRYRPALVFMFLTWFEEYLEPDPSSGNFRFWDADSTHRYELIAGVELSHNTIAANNRMTAYVRLEKDQPSPKRRFLYRF